MDVGATIELDSPSGGAGEDTARCGCGARRHPEHEDRCASGHVLPGNTTAAVVGHRGRAFWREHDALYRDTCEEIATDLGHDGYDDAPAAARAGIDGLAQAVIVRDAAYRRMLESGGPLTSRDRPRRATKVHEKYDRRCEAWARQLGMERAPKPVPSLDEYMAERQAVDGKEAP